MVVLLEELAKYIAEHTNTTLGTDIFYFTMPDDPDCCISIEEPKLSTPVLAQINAESHYIRINVRHISSDSAYQLAKLCHRWLLTDDPTYTEDSDIVPTGFITLLNGLSVYIQLHGEPLTDKTDQQGRRYFYLTATLISKRII